jgi:hypothetical protein
MAVIRKKTKPLKNKGTIILPGANGFIGKVALLRVYWPN